MKHDTFKFNGEWGSYLGTQPKVGIWSIYGREKHGKTAFALQLAKYLCTLERVLYISAEEGTDPLFIQAVKRAEIPSTRNFGFLPYVTLDEIDKVLTRRNPPRIIFLDNMTMYMDEFRGNGIVEFIRKYEDFLFIFISHEERNGPATAAGRLVNKLAKVIVRIEGLQALISGRCPGGIMPINANQAEMFGNYDSLTQNSKQ